MNVQTISNATAKPRWEPFKELRLHLLELLIGIIERDEIRHLLVAERAALLGKRRAMQAKRIAALIRREF